MATHTLSSESFAMRLGQSLGRVMGGVLCAERALWSTLSRAGLPGVIVTPVKWLARAVVVVGGTVLAAWGLLYVLAVVAMVAIVVGLMTSSGNEHGLEAPTLRSENGKTSMAELDDGVDGFGLYLDGTRVD